LALRRELDHDGFTRGGLEAAGLVVGFGTSAVAVRLAWRVAGHQIAWPRNSRAPAAAWRGIWLLLVAGAGVGFAGAALMVSGIRQWDAQVHSGALMFGVGGVLLLLAIAVYGWGRKHLSAAATVRQRIAIEDRR